MYLVKSSNFAIKINMFKTKQKYSKLRNLFFDVGKYTFKQNYLKGEIHTYVLSLSCIQTILMRKYIKQQHTRIVIDILLLGVLYNLWRSPFLRMKQRSSLLRNGVT